MGIDLNTIKDPRLREKIEAQLLSTPPLARPQLTPLDSGKPGEGVERERDLHDEIEEFCRAEGWYYIHSRMDRRTTITVGAPDFVVFMPYGRVLCLECKRKGGKLTLAQEAALTWLSRLKHNTAVVYDFKEAKLALLLVAATGRSQGIFQPSPVPQPESPPGSAPTHPTAHPSQPA